jgi:hypothetical protein
MASSITSAIQIQRRVSGDFELLVDANLFSFSVRQENLQVTIYHSGGAKALLP